MPNTSLLLFDGLTDSFSKTPTEMNERCLSLIEVALSNRPSSDIALYTSSIRIKKFFHKPRSFF